MDYLDAIKMFYDSSSTCPDKKTIPTRSAFENTLEMRCKNWKLTIDKQKTVNVYDKLENLLNDREYTIYQNYIKLIEEGKKKIAELRKKEKLIEEDIAKLFSIRKEVFSKIDINKISDKKKEELQRHYLKYKLERTSQFNENEKNYLNWMEVSIRYIKLQNTPSIDNDIKMIEKGIQNYVIKKGVVKESSSSSIGKKVKKIKINKK